MSEFWIVSAVVFGVLLIAIFSSMWLAVSMGLVGYMAMFIFGNADVAGNLAALALRNSLFSFSITALPLFILMGELVSTAGIGRLLFDGLTPICERLLKGGLVYATIVACAAFGAVCGSSIAGSASIGKIAMPELRKRGYSDSLAGGALAAGGPLSTIIPPSLAFIMFGTIASVSISKLFIAGIVPGVVLTSLMVVVTSLVVLRWPHLVPPRPVQKRSLGEYCLPLLKVLPIMGLAFFVLYSIYGGIATPTEASSVGVLGTVIIGLFVRKGKVGFIWNSLKSAAQLSTMLLFLVIGATVFSLSLNNIGFTRMITGVLSDLVASPVATVVVIAILYIILGLFIDGMSLLIITTPVVYPVLYALGFDPLVIGIVICLLTSVGNLTPPVGLNLFVVHSLYKLDVFTISRGALPFLFCYLIALVLLYFFPILVTWLPSFMH